MKDEVSQKRSFITPIIYLIRYFATEGGDKEIPWTLANKHTQVWGKSQVKTRHERPEEGIPSIVSLFSSGKNFLNFMVRPLVRKYMIGKEKNLREV